MTVTFEHILYQIVLAPQHPRSARCVLGTCFIFCQQIAHASVTGQEAAIDKA